MHFRSPPQLIGYSFSLDAVNECRRHNGLLSLRIETSRLCNLRCIYCNSSSGNTLNNEISFVLIKDVILQASSMGAKSIVVIGGGEPTIYPQFRQLINYINALGMVPVVVTNGMTLSIELASFLNSTNCSVLLKYDSLDKGTQDFFADKPGAYEKIREAIAVLEGVGMNTITNEGQLRVGLSFVTTTLNILESIDIWKYCRSNNFYPNQEFIVPNGRARDHLDLIPSQADIFKNKKDLLDFDRKQYGYNWLVYKPLTAIGCLQFLYSLYIDILGYIRPCAAIQNNLIHISKFSLQEAINHPFISYVRNIDKHLSGKCLSCQFNFECYGCRGNAYTIGKLQGLDDYEAISSDDPFCMKPESTDSLEY